MKLLFFFIIISLFAYIHALGGRSGSSLSSSGFSSAGSKGNGNYADGKRGFVNGDYQPQESPKPSNRTIEQRTVRIRRGIGISAWGIVALIVSVILCTMGAYYFIIFYPMICKKHNSYDLIELTNV